MRGVNRGVMARFHVHRLKKKVTDSRSSLTTQQFPSQPELQETLFLKDVGMEVGVKSKKMVVIFKTERNVQCSLDIDTLLTHV